MMQQKATEPQVALSNPALVADSGVVLLREAGVPFQPSLGNVDPIDEWIGLVEAVQMLCPNMSARVQPTVGKEWKL